MTSCSLRNIPSPPPALKQNLHKIEEDFSGEGQFEDMEQDWSTPPVTLLSKSFNPPDISVTDEQGNVHSHSQFPSSGHNRTMVEPHLDSPATTAYESVLKNHRSHTFTTLADAYEHATHLPTTQEVSNVNYSLPSNGILTQMAILHNGYEDIAMSSKTAHDIINSLKRVLDSQHIEYNPSSALSIQLNHSNVQLKMEVIESGNQFNSLRFRHLSGDCSLSRQLCNQLLHQMTL